MSYLENLHDPCWLRTIIHLLGTDIIEVSLMFVKRDSIKGFSLSGGKSQAAHQVKHRETRGEKHWESWNSN